MICCLLAWAETTCFRRAGGERGGGDERGLKKNTFCHLKAPQLYLFVWHFSYKTQLKGPHNKIKKT